MKKKTILLILFCGSFVHFSDAQFFQRTYGDVNYELGFRFFMAPDSGYVLFAGSGITGQNLEMIRTDRYGDSLWTKTISAYPHYSDYCQTFDKGYAVVSAQGDTVFITKLDSSCDFQSVAFYVDTNGYRPYKIIQTSDSAYLISGSIYRSYSPFASTIFITKISSAGNILWTDTMLYYTQSGEHPVGMIETSDHFYVIAVYRLSGDNTPGTKQIIKLDTAGNVIWIKGYAGFYEFINGDYRTFYPMVESDSGYLILANSRGHSWDYGKCIVMNLDTAGNLRGTKFLDDYSYFCITRSISGGFYLTGTLSDTTSYRKLLITQVDSNIDSLTSFQFNVPFYSTHGNYITQLADGRLAAIGSLDNGNNLEDVFFVVCDSSGNTFTSVNSINMAENSISIYPNPTTSTFTIKNISFSERSLLQIFNPLGEIVYTSALTEKQQTINAKLASGIYFVRVGDEQRSVVRKLIVE